MRARLLRLAGLLALAAGGAGAAFGEGGAYLEEELVKTGSDGAPRAAVVRTWVVPGKLRKEDPSSGTIQIVRDDRKAVWVLNPAERTWFELDRAELDRLGQAGLAMLGTGPAAAGADWFTPTGRERRIGGWAAREVAAQDRPLPGIRIALWLSREVELDPALRDTARTTFGSGNAGGLLLDALRRLDGYPVEVEVALRIGPQILEIRQTLKKIEKLDVDPARFEIPGGFVKTDHPLGALLGVAPAPSPAAPAEAVPAASPAPARTGR